jgi:tetratricopeptide (TPR) repeat protein
LPTSVDCRFILGSNLRLLFRHDEAVRVYREALDYDRRPELYLNLGMALVEAGRTEEAMEPLVLAGVFEPMYIPQIYPDEIRMRVDDIVSKRRLLPWHEVLPKEKR